MKSSLEQLEQRIQRLVEAGAARLFPSPDLVTYLVHHLVMAIGPQLRSEADGRTIAPNHFIIGLHPSVAYELRNGIELQDHLLRLIKEAAMGAGLHFLADPSLTVYEDQDLSPADPHILAEFQPGKLEQTKNLGPTASGADVPLPHGAFMIVNGTDVFPLRQSVVNIGRRLDNHLHIDDPRVSRLHAQLRVMDNQFVIFDLGSTGGTYVNDHRIDECYIYPGDVISLAGVILVFGQDPQHFSDESVDYTRRIPHDDMPSDLSSDRPDSSRDDR